jgi:beta-lactamase class A
MMDLYHPFSNIGGTGMKPGRWARSAAALLGSVSLGITAGGAQAAAGGAQGAVRAAAGSVSCASSSHPALAAKLARDIAAARRGRVSAVAVGVDDPALGLTCWLNGSQHFDSASVVKAIILAALLRKALDQDRFLTGREDALAAAMITRSDNNAASALWADTGRRALQRFLGLAQMRQTLLGAGGFWGLTQITAHDEVLLLRLLLNKNTVLDTASRDYELSLMAKVIGSQRWGVPAGAPTTLTVHVKNGWLPRATHGWRIHSIGGFTGHGVSYGIVVLTQDNPTMSYGIRTIEAIARAVNHDLNPAARSVVPASTPAPSWNTPDERIPAEPGIP